MNVNENLHNNPLNTQNMEFIHHVYIVEDDSNLRQALQRILTYHRYEVHAFENAQEFLALDSIKSPSVLITDMRLNGLSGEQLQKELLNRGHFLPIIFISGETTVQQTISAMKQGALDFLLKPFEIEDLINSVAKGIDKSISHTKSISYKNKLEISLQNLTKREKEMYFLLLEGYNNMELEKALNLKMNTIKDYKSKVMQKMGVETLAELIRLGKVSES
jgi:FixJ family two-component response regulator